MKYLAACHTDVGTRRNTNQDSLLVMRAISGQGQVLLAAVCDGMGGLDRGEAASAAVVKALSVWFSEGLSPMITEGIREEKLFSSWKRMTDEVGRKISEYGQSREIRLGTTAAVLLLFDGRFFLMNVGDSRIYRLNGSLDQLTKDQTYVQREVDAGRMTKGEALMSTDRHVLLQCIGAGGETMPDFLAGNTEQGDVFLLCSDGFRNMLLPEEFRMLLAPEEMLSEERMRESLEELTKRCLLRGEQDNISAIAVKVCGDF